MNWYTHLNGYVQFFIALPFIAAFFLIIGLGVAKLTMWEIGRFEEQFEREHHRPPRPDEYPDPEPYGPHLN